MLTGGAGYGPTPRRIAAEALKEVGLRRDETFYDLGCGTGGVLVEASSICDHVKGIEVEPLRWLISRLRARKADVLFGNLFKHSISDADVIFIFQYPGAVNSRISMKIKAETKDGTRVVSYCHPMEGMRLVKDYKRDHNYIFIYEK